MKLLDIHAFNLDHKDEVVTINHPILLWKLHYMFGEAFSLCRLFEFEQRFIRNIVFIKEKLK